MKRALCIAMMFVATVTFTQAQDSIQSQRVKNSPAQLQGSCKKCKCKCTGNTQTCTCKCVKCKKSGCGKRK